MIFFLAFHSLLPIAKKTHLSANDEQNWTSAEWVKVVKKKRSYKKTTIVGRATDVGIKAAGQYGHLHAYKLVLFLTAEQLEKYLT